MTLRIEPTGGQEFALREAAASLREAPAKATAEAGGVDFTSVLEQSVADANNLQTVATQKSEALAKGASDDLHGTMISLKEAEISMKLVGTVRNKLLDAFHELWRINL